MRSHVYAYIFVSLLFLEVYSQPDIRVSVYSRSNSIFNNIIASRNCDDLRDTTMMLRRKERKACCSGSNHPGDLVRRMSGPYSSGSVISMLKKRKPTQPPNLTFGSKILWHQDYDRLQILRNHHNFIIPSQSRPPDDSTALQMTQ